VLGWRNVFKDGFVLIFMKRGLVVGVVLLGLVCMGVFAYANIFNLSGFVVSMESIDVVETDNLVAGNGICEYYYKQFSEGEEDAISINGETLNLKYLGDNDWSLNGYKGDANNRLYEYVKKPEAKGVRFDSSGPYNLEGYFKITEQDYYGSDCLGINNLSSTKMFKYIYEVPITEGWNLVPAIDTVPSPCNYGLYNEICDDDISSLYLYLPFVKEYYSGEDLTALAERYNLKEEEDLISTYNRLLAEGNEEEIGLYISVLRRIFSTQSSNWIYVKPYAEDKKFTYSSYYSGRYSISNPGPRENFLMLDEGLVEYEMFFNVLEDGWNFLSVIPEMVFDDGLNIDSLSLDDMTIDCDIESAYLFDNGDKEWIILGSDEKFTEDMVGKGMIVKVSEECKIGDDRDMAVPDLPEAE